MWCYCTPSQHHQCNVTTGMVQCAQGKVHCLIGKAGLRVTQSCWEWPSTAECPDVIGPCYLLGRNVKNPACCCKGSLCNSRFVNFSVVSKQLKQTTMSLSTEYPISKIDFSFLCLLFGIIFTVTLMIILLVILLKRFIICQRCFPKSQSKSKKSWNRNENIKENYFQQKITKKETEENVVLIRNWENKNSYTRCSKHQIIAEGRFGKVWSGQIFGDKNEELELVAIKVFTNNTEGKKSWRNELFIYSMLKNKPHKNILLFYGAEKKQCDLDIELWLVVEYHPLGSLWKFLKESVINWNVLLKICYNIISGLAHLHSFSSHSPIAHRDIKSKNILLKNDFTACIADFGLAICQKNCGNSFNNRVGTLSYMAPEILEGSINFDIYSFLRIDIFSMALVFWEVLNRCEFPGLVVPDFQVPLQDIVGEKPTLEELHRCVSGKKLRPTFNPIWSQFPDVMMLWKTITECWDEDPEARLNAECILDRLETLYKTCNFIF